jgi:D-alanyl-D-alanine carboxypeptidase
MKRLLLPLLLMTLWLPGCTSGGAASAPTQGTSRIHELLRSYYPADQPGAIVLAKRDGEVVLRSAFGLADLELQAPLRPEHRMKIGSVTKGFTAAAVLALATEGRLKLTDTIRTHLPDWPAATREVTLEQLLTHRGGLREYTPLPEYGAALRQDATRAEMLALIGKQPAESAPGTAFRYTNSAYFVLGVIVEKVTGGTLHDFVRSRFLEPLALKDTTFDEILTVIPQRVSGYGRQDGKVTNAQPYSPTRAFAVGDMLSTADDLARWVEALHGGTVPGISPDLRASAFESRRLPDGRDTGYGLGWFVNEFEGARVVEHGGDLPGFSVHLLHIPQHRVTVAVLSNDAQHDPRPDFVATQVASFLIGKPWDPPSAGVPLSAAELERILGTYVSATGTKRTILTENGRLYLERNGRRTELAAAAADRLFVPRSFVQFRFVPDASGQLELVLEQKGQETDRGKRIRPDD